MRVILTEDVPKLGDMGEIVEVKPGFGRNYLIPKGLAVLADKGSARHIEHLKANVDRKKAKLRQEALSIVSGLQDLSVTIPRQTGEGDKLYGSVTNRDVEAALAEQGFKIDRKKIQLAQPIKELGVYRVPLRLHSDVKTHIRVWVTAV